MSLCLHMPVGTENQVALPTSTGDAMVSDVPDPSLTEDPSCFPSDLVVLDEVLKVFFLETRLTGI
eukprot:IDg1759t1